MSLDPKYNKHHAPAVLTQLEDLDALEQIATAAGHGYAELNPVLNAGWVDVTIAEENVRPNYDIRHIKTFSPELMRALLFELSEARKKIADYENVTA